jgi:hypothetical protein
VLAWARHTRAAGELYCNTTCSTPGSLHRIHVAYRPGRPLEAVAHLVAGTRSSYREGACACTCS